MTIVQQILIKYYKVIYMHKQMYMHCNCQKPHDMGAAILMTQRKKKIAIRMYSDKTNSLKSSTELTSAASVE